MSAFVLSRSYELQLPNNYVDVDMEEMEYTDGGGLFVPNWVVGGAVDVAVFAIPQIKALKGAAIGVAMLSTTARTAVARAICKAITKATFGILTVSENKALGAIKAFTGFSIGTFVAQKLVDPLDGQYNGGYKVW